MTPISPAGAATPPAPADPSGPASTDAMNAAFAQGVVQFIGIMLQGAESDVQEACNDTVSTPDAPS